MRVDATTALDPSQQLEVPWQSDSGHYLDLRANVRSIYQIEISRQHPPLGRFLATVNNEDSVFTTATSSVEHGSDPGDGAEPHRFTSRVALIFARDDFNFDTSHFEGLIGQLERLLDRDSPADSLAVALRIGPCRFPRMNREGFHLVITLTATGNTAEQAEMRWGLGLVRLQQALLFLSRVVRQHLRDRSG